MFGKLRIGALVASPSLIGRILNLSDDRQVEIESKSVGLDDAIPIGIKMVKNGVEAIISRRGTAQLLRENLHIPVLSFPHRSLDLLDVIKKASLISDRIVLVVFRKRLEGLTIIEELLNIKLLQAIYEDKASMERVIADASLNGYKVVVGGNLTFQLAKTYGLKFVEVQTSDEDIISTLDDAKSIVQTAREQKATARRYRTIIDSASESIILVDAQGRLLTFNKAAKRVLELSDQNDMNRPLNNIIPDCPIHSVLMNEKSIIDRMGQINQDSYIFNYTPITLEGKVIGAVVAFRDIDKVVRTENVVRRSLAKGLVAKYKLDEFVHTNQKMKQVVNMAREYAKINSTVLIAGETGTGKEIFAHGIHDLSSRTSKPFVSINCAALPEQLLESELFGYEEGAFTGSKKGGKAGLFEVAHQGTIFLDEIDSTPKLVQVRLLRVIQEREVMRVGGARKIPVDVRVVAAIGSDLEKAVQEGKFREDLYFRLNVLRIQIPPLRERKEDIVQLIQYFIRFFADRYGHSPIQLTDEYLERLESYSWPGNVRQLRNFAERLVMNHRLSGVFSNLESLYQELLAYSSPKNQEASKIAEQPTLKQNIRQKAFNNDKEIIKDALALNRFNKTKTANMLKVSRSTLWRKMKEYGLS